MMIASAWRIDIIPARHIKLPDWCVGNFVSHLHWPVLDPMGWTLCVAGVGHLLMTCRVMSVIWYLCPGRHRLPAMSLTSAFLLAMYVCFAWQLVFCDLHASIVGLQHLPCTHTCCAGPRATTPPLFLVGDYAMCLANQTSTTHCLTGVLANLSRTVASPGPCASVFPCVWFC